MARKIVHLDWSEQILRSLIKNWLEICRKIQDVKQVKVKIYAILEIG